MLSVFETESIYTFQTSCISFSKISKILFKKLGFGQSASNLYNEFEAH